MRLPPAVLRHLPCLQQQQHSHWRRQRYWLLSHPTGAVCFMPPCLQAWGPGCFLLAILWP